MLTPFYLCSLLYSISNDDKRKDYYDSMKIAVIASFLLGFAMLFVRVQETSNWKISCKKFLFSSGSESDLLINPDQEKKEVTTISISQVLPGGTTNNISNFDLTNLKNAPTQKKKKM